MKENYGILLENTIRKITHENVRPTLLLHVCCAPCSSYVLEYLSQYFDITLYYHNPNIYPESEFEFRLNELGRFVAEAGYSIDIDAPEYNANEFFEAIKGFENIPEGGDRCRICYELRLRQTAIEASTKKFDYFTTTLSISPYKNAQWLNEIGRQLESEYGVKYLYSDFKKKNGYKRSIELSNAYGLYRQDYCGCVFSKTEAENRKK